ncbi:MULTISPECIES: 3'-5' exonuclease [unclassified Rhizobium]|jgi:DNA polymerase-3 subunit epsilon|uniref:3'-5' exonuclease n=1 Tax=unclassified Rhizobium TaxID=2613769 RepID=UPI000647B44A|nr:MULTISPECIES: 3'-5' exonuclease [unclassified Rhizobium]OJY68367.1 MAG: DNA polymerase III subunit epsilon [Rhizobium sp. 60-20]RKD45246.1 DNA polymerase-3 subunit epsilon [Rhizobium sp. WW_1]
MTSQLDMFSENAQSVRGASAPTSRVRQAGSTPNEAEMVRILQATGRYQILKKLEPRAIAPAPRPGYPLRGVILDTETTGLDAKKDEIIEIGLIGFTFNEEGEIGDVTDVYGRLQQPSIPIPVEVTRLTGISDAMVLDQMIDMPAVRALIEPADLIIAHNAGFDRPFCEAFSSVFARKAWACSNSEIDWSARGYEGTKLGYLINQSGYFHVGHRAVDDCFALLEVLALTRSGAEQSPFAELYQASQRSRVRIFAENSPFDLKDRLKERGYRWSDGSDGRPKSWWIEIAEELLEDELRFLRTEIYRWQDADPPVQRLTALDRFKGRR